MDGFLEGKNEGVFLCLLAFETFVDLYAHTDSFKYLFLINAQKRTYIQHICRKSD
jgi:hypothetical protein